MVGPVGPRVSRSPIGYRRDPGRYRCGPDRQRHGPDHLRRDRADAGNIVSVRATAVKPVMRYGIGIPQLVS